MPADRDAVRDGGPRRSLGFGTEVAVSLVGYLLVYLLAHLLLRRAAFASPWLKWLPEARQAAYLAQAAGNDLLGQVALLSVPLLLVGSVLCYLREQEPLRGLGLSSSLGCLPVSFLAVLTGFVAYLALLLGVLRLGGGDVIGHLALVAISFRQHLEPWQELGWLGLFVLPAAVFSYSTARLLLPYGHLLPLLRERFQPATAGAMAALLFVLPYSFTPAITPLAVLNLVLLSLILERLRVRTDSLWPPLFAFCGWVLCAELSGLPHQGMLPNRETVLDVLPPLLSGGGYGPEGGLVATLMFALLLIPLVGLPHKPVAPAKQAPAEPAA